MKTKYVLLALIALLVVPVAMAGPQIPARIQGNVYVDGDIIDDVFTLYAIDFHDNTVSQTLTGSDGSYVMKVSGLSDGAAIVFELGGDRADETVLFDNKAITVEDLHFESVCGDGICVGDETAGNCAADCSGTPPPAPPATPQCSDGLDNDGDGLIDFPADTDCTSLADNSEATPAPPAPGGGGSSDSSKKKTSGGGGGAIEEEDEDVEDTVADKEDMSIKPGDGEAVTGSAIGIFTQQTAVIIVAVLIVAGIGYLYLLRH